MKPIEFELAMLNCDYPKAHWKKPAVARLVTQGAEASDNFSGEGAGNFS